MPRTTHTPTDQYREMGLTNEAEWTEHMRLAIRQRWNNLPVDHKVDDLRAAIAAVKQEETPTAEMLMARGFSDGDAEACRTEANRLKRNATVNAWRARGQLQAALDARELVYAARRARRHTVAAA